MMNKELPKKYKWLSSEGAPKMLVEALKLYGTLESPGTADNPVIISWAQEVGGSVDDVYKADSIPWCGLLMAIVAKRAGKTPPKEPLWALNWGTFGVRTEEAMLGDVLVFVRKGGGHVGLYCGEDEKCFHVLGGNQSDAVTITRINKSRLYTIRRPVYSIAQPPNVRKVILDSGGAVSENEA
jgi:uncharacterized protein (TIGR02594 family)